MVHFSSKSVTRCIVTVAYIATFLFRIGRLKSPNIHGQNLEGNITRWQYNLQLTLRIRAQLFS